MQVLRAHCVDLHGELVLLLHWSLLNFAAVLKIVKKHDKLNTGRNLRAAISRVITNQVRKCLRNFEWLHIMCISHDYLLLMSTANPPVSQFTGS
jgi:SPX domain protein involved in polyphosphate accumulation